METTELESPSIHKSYFELHKLSIEMSFHVGLSCLTLQFFMLTHIQLSEVGMKTCCIISFSLATEWVSLLFEALCMAFIAILSARHNVQSCLYKRVKATRDVLHIYDCCLNYSWYSGPASSSRGLLSFWDMLFWRKFCPFNVHRNFDQLGTLLVKQLSSNDRCCILSYYNERAFLSSEVVCGIQQTVS